MAGAVLGDLTTDFSDHATFASITHETAGWIDEVIGKIPADGNVSLKEMVLEPGTLTEKGSTLADHVAILHEGRLVRCQPFDDFQRSETGRSLEEAFIDILERA